jgi:hypothetical protein
MLSASFALGALRDRSVIYWNISLAADTGLLFVLWHYQDNDAYVARARTLGVDVVGLEPGKSRFYGRL